MYYTQMVSQRGEFADIIPDLIQDLRPQGQKSAEREISETRISDPETICAVSTAPGVGGIAVIRVSGEEAVEVCDRIFEARKEGHRLASQESGKVCYGTVRQGDTLIDEALVTVFRAPHSFTGEDTVEISCHGSIYIQQQIQKLLIDNGCRSARGGEFTQRAFLNGKLDLSQAEAVADLIASTSAAAHALALKQLRGGVSSELAQLRSQLLNFITLIELELDFSEEDVTFADRASLETLANTIYQRISGLAESFSIGNAIKSGIPVAIIGEPNVGKSTLLNALLNEDRAIVSEIPGTTRDTIEETLYLDGQVFRFIDTAGLRDNATDPIERLGINRSMERARQAAIILYLFDLTRPAAENREAAVHYLHDLRQPILMFGTKRDLIDNLADIQNIVETDNYPSLPLYISCKDSSDIAIIKKEIVNTANLPSIESNDVIITNLRHYESLCHARSAIGRVLEGLSNQIPTDFLAQDIREGLHYLGEITGEISSEEVLENIFSRFCIGK